MRADPRPPGSRKPWSVPTCQSEERSAAKSRDARLAVVSRIRRGVAVAVVACALGAAAGCGAPPLPRPTPTPGTPRPSSASPTPTGGVPLPLPTPTPSAGGSPSFSDSVAVDCGGRPSAAQVVRVLRRNISRIGRAKVTVTTGPLCAGTWQYTVVSVPGEEPLAVVTEGRPRALRLVTAGTDVCSIPVRTGAPPGIRIAAAC
jgi:hypothetical protein